MFVWCHESVQEFDPGLPRHPSLSPLARGEHAEENLRNQETLPCVGHDIPREVCDARNV